MDSLSTEGRPRLPLQRPPGGSSTPAVANDASSRQRRLRHNRKSHDHTCKSTTAAVSDHCTCRSTLRRSWNSLDANAFRAGLRTSLLCQTDAWSTLDVDGLAQLYNFEITMLLDQLIPARSVTYRRRPSHPWFDDECRVTKRSDSSTRARRSSGRDVRRGCCYRCESHSVENMQCFVGGNAKRSGGT